VTDGKFFIAQIMFLSHKKSLNVKISNKKISFFSSRNQYFPHIPYVASKKSKSTILNFSVILGINKPSQKENVEPGLEVRQMQLK
jgi:hypothetical protein